MGGDPKRRDPPPKEMGRPQRNSGDPMDVGWSSMSAGGTPKFGDPPPKEIMGGDPKTHSGCGAELNEWQRLT